MSRNYNDELQFLDRIGSNCWRIKKGFVPNMQVNFGVFKAQRSAMVSSQLAAVGIITCTTNPVTLLFGEKKKKLIQLLYDSNGHLWSHVITVKVIFSVLYVYHQSLDVE